MTEIELALRKAAVLAAKKVVNKRPQEARDLVALVERNPVVIRETLRRWTEGR